MFTDLRGNCPMQNKEYTISVKVFDRKTKHVGRVECEYMRHGGDCNQSSCPIVKQNGYHH